MGVGQKSEARPRAPTRKTADRRQNNGGVKAVSPRHCAATSVLRNCCFNCRAEQTATVVEMKGLLLHMESS